METTIDTKVARVRLYRSGAEVTRAGDVQLEPGPNKIYVTNIPSSARFDSVRAKFPARVSQGNVRVATSLPDSVKRDVLDEVSELESHIKLLDKRIDNKRSQKKLWCTNADFRSAVHTDIEDRVAFLDKLAERLDDVDEELIELEKRRDKLTEKLKELAPGYDGDTMAAKGTVRVLLIEVVASEAGSYHFELCYQTGQVRWHPCYELHVDELGGPISLSLRGQLRQVTGEDWKDVEISLCSTTMGQAFTPPELHVRYLDMYAPPSSKRFKGVAAAAPVAQLDYAAPEEALADLGQDTLIELSEPQAVRGDQQMMSVYELPGTWDVESSADGRSVAIETTELEASYQALCVPSADDSCYLTASVHDAEQLDLFACTAHIHLEGTFSGSIGIDPDSVSAGRPLLLGRDERVHAERTRVRKYTSNVLLGGKTKTEHAFRIELTNRRDKSVSMHVSDQVPVSRNKEIEVKVVNAGGATHDEKTGELCWEFDLAAGGKRTLEFSYEVLHPKNKRIEEVDGGSMDRAWQFTLPDRHCTRCGCLVEGGVTFCPSCGTRMDM